MGRLGKEGLRSLSIVPCFIGLAVSSFSSSSSCSPADALLLLLLPFPPPSALGTRAPILHGPGTFPGALATGQDTTQSHSMQRTAHRIRTIHITTHSIQRVARITQRAALFPARAAQLSYTTDNSGRTTSTTRNFTHATRNAHHASRALTSSQARTHSSRTAHTRTPTPTRNRTDLHGRPTRKDVFFYEPNGQQRRFPFLSD